jgi:hypothetical protein
LFALFVESLLLLLLDERLGVATTRRVKRFCPRRERRDFDIGSPPSRGKSLRSPISDAPLRDPYGVELPGPSPLEPEEPDPDDPEPDEPEFELGPLFDPSDPDGAELEPLEVLEELEPLSRLGPLESGCTVCSSCPLTFEPGPELVTATVAPLGPGPSPEEVETVGDGCEGSGDAGTAESWSRPGVGPVPWGREAVTPCRRSSPSRSRVRVR